MQRAISRTVSLLLEDIAKGVYDVWHPNVYRGEDELIKLGRVVKKDDGWTAFDTWGFPLVTGLPNRQTALDALTVED